MLAQPKHSGQDSLVCACGCVNMCINASDTWQVVARTSEIPSSRSESKQVKSSDSESENHKLEVGIESEDGLRNLDKENLCAISSVWHTVRRHLKCPQTS